MRDFFWSGIGRIGYQGLSLVFGILLARILGPEAVGLFALTQVFTVFATLLVDSGLSSALIQRSTVSREEVSALHTVSVMIGVGTGLLFFFVAPQISRLMKMDDLDPLLRLLSIVQPLTAATAIPMALMIRSNRFRAISLVEVTAMLTGGSTAVVLALLGAGVWSMVWQAIMVALIQVILLYRVLSPRPAFTVRLTTARSFARFSSNLLAFNVANYWARNFDTFIVGQTLGSGAVGLYSRAYQLATLPVFQFLGVVSRVMLPRLSEVQDDLKEFARRYKALLRLASITALPLLAGLASVAPDLIDVVLGPEWHHAAIILRILSVASITQVFASQTGLIYASVGRTGLQFRWGMVASAGMVLGIYLGSLMGSSEAVAWGYAIANLVLLVPNLMIPYSLVQLPLSEAVAASNQGLAASGVMVLTILLVQRLTGDDLSVVASLAIQIAAGCVVFVAMAWSLRVPEVVSVLDKIQALRTVARLRSR